MYNSNLFITSLRDLDIITCIINRNVYIQIKGISIRSKLVTNTCVNVQEEYLHRRLLKFFGNLSDVNKSKDRLVL